MPAKIIKSYAKKTGKSEKELEKTWKDATKEASKMGQEKNFAYVTTIFKTMLGLSESITDLFLQSDTIKFNEFYSKEKLNIQEMLVSSSIPQDLRPEVPYTKDKGKKKKPIVIHNGQGTIYYNTNYATANKKNNTNK